MIQIKPIPETGEYELVYDYIYSKTGFSVLVPAGTRWDGASIPGAFWRYLNLTPFHPKVMRASLVHDYLYATQGVCREEADKLFYDILVEDGVEKEKAERMYVAVQAFGSLFWDGHEEDRYIREMIEDLN